MTTQSPTSSHAAPVVAAPERTEALIAALLAFVFGIGLVYTTGFSYPAAIHNAAHDTRHALSFPCH